MGNGESNNSKNCSEMNKKDILCPDNSQNDLSVKCGKCNLMQIGSKESINCVSCRSGHVVCLNCWHKYVLTVIEQRSPDCVCCATVDPVCKSRYSLSTMMDNLSLREFRLFMDLYGNCIGSMFNIMPTFMVQSSGQQGTLLKKKDNFVPLPFAFPSKWYFEVFPNFFGFFFFLKEGFDNSSVRSWFGLQSKWKENGR
jgi:hypothetical protein